MNDKELMYPSQQLYMKKKRENTKKHDTQYIGALAATIATAVGVGVPTIAAILYENPDIIK